MSDLGSPDDRLRAAWLEAARDLGITVSVDQRWLLDADGERHAVMAIIEGFGARRGTAIFSIDDFSAREMDASELRVEDGYYESWLGHVYELYDRELFVDTLNDWGWAGDGEPPPWYTGQPVDETA